MRLIRKTRGAPLGTACRVLAQPPVMTECDIAKRHNQKAGQTPVKPLVFTGMLKTGILHIQIRRTKQSLMTLRIPTSSQNCKERP